MLGSLLRIPPRRAVTGVAAALVWLGLAVMGPAPWAPLAPAAAAAAERICLSGSAAQSVVYSGQARRLSELRGAIEGELIRADLCRDGDRYVYAVTTLGADGKVRRRLVDATPSGQAPSRPAKAAPMLAVPVTPDSN